MGPGPGTRFCCVLRALPSKARGALCAGRECASNASNGACVRGGGSQRGRSSVLRAHGHCAELGVLCTLQGRPQGRISARIQGFVPRVNSPPQHGGRRRPPQRSARRMRRLEASTPGC
eukprot:Amastigsp_a186091_34.p1 type:complete len:118 gc:universal Amastigsp_a186091_34:533-180(-)